MRAARIAGLQHRQELTLGDVDRRRTQLWSTSLFVIAAITVVIALLAVGEDFIPEQFQLENMSSWVVFVLVAGLAMAFLIYIVEKEMSLRNVSKLLVEERIRTTALRSRVTEISTLSEIGKALNTTLHLEDVFRLILSSALDMLDGDEGSIMLLDLEQTNLEVMSYQGSRGKQVMSIKVPLGQGVAGSVATTRRSMLLQGELAEDRGPDEERGIHSSMCVPLVRRGELLGVLNLNEISGRRAFVEDDLRALELFAEHAAIAIGNATAFEQERHTVARLEELDRLKSDFVATVSHELKTPLTAIIGAAKTVSRKGTQMSPDQHASFMEMIERQGTRLLRLVEDVLTAARIESGLPRMRREQIGLRDLAELVMEDLSHSKVGRGREVKLVCKPDNPQAWGDLTMLQQILANLTENALKYSEADANVSITMIETPSEAVMEVRDEGHGISQEQLRTIFDRFRQADSSATRTVGGFGLGLYIVKNLVEAHRGDIEVQSEIGKGTTFKVRLPQRSGDRAGHEVHDAVVAQVGIGG